MIPQAISSDDLFHYTNSWHWRAVEVLCSRSDFSEDPKWIAGKIAMTEDEARDAIQGLERIGYVRRDENGRLLANSEYHYYSLQTFERVDLYNFHERFSKVIAAKLTAKDGFANNLMLTNKDDMSDFYERFIDLIKEFNAKSAKNPNSKEVYGIALSQCSLSRGKD